MTGAQDANAPPTDALRSHGSPPCKRSPVVGLVLVCAGALVGPLDTAVNVAFPAITGAFGLPLRAIQWIVISFVVAQSVFTLVFGRLGDLFGHRRIFAIGMAACALAHFAMGFAPSYGWLVAMRAVQGVAVGVAVACAPALATLLFPPQDKRRVLAVYVATFSFGLALGPLAGGALVDWLGWPGVFWFRAPLALLVLLLLPLLADVQAPRAQAAEAEAARPADLPVNTATPDRGRGAIAAGLRSRAFVATQLGSVVINFTCFSILLLVPYAVARWPGQSVAASGALLALLPGGSLLGGLLAGRAARVPSSTAMIRAGLGTAALGLLLTAWLLPLQAAAALGAALLTTGLGMGVFQVGYMDATTSLLPPQDRGLAGALVTVTRLLGIVLGVTGIGALHEAMGSFAQPIAAMGATLLLAAALAWLVRAS